MQLSSELGKTRALSAELARLREEMQTRSEAAAKLVSGRVQG